VTADVSMIGSFTTNEDGETVHSFPIQVYWEDTDAGGIVYYANYLKFIERARTDLLRGLGINQQTLMIEDGLNFVVRDCRIEYLQPARMDDSLHVRTRLSELKGATMRMLQSVHKNDQTLIKSEIRVACLQANGRPARFSPQIRDKFSSITFSSGAAKT